MSVEMQSYKNNVSWWFYRKILITGIKCGMICVLGFEDLLCDVTNMNLSSVLHNLESMNISQQIQQVSFLMYRHHHPGVHSKDRGKLSMILHFFLALQYISLMTNQNKASFECRSLFSTLKDITDSYQKLINQTYLPGAKTWQCLEQLPSASAKLFSGDVL